jgi:hypothetical protein
MPRSRNFTFAVRATQGGRLVTVASPENVGVGNYAVKTNWRRLNDKEILREGTLLFKPKAGDQGTQHLNIGPAEVLGLWECIRPNGDRSVVAATATTIYRFNYTTGVWDSVGTGFSASTVAWEGESLDGYLILNNRIDLPVTLRAEDASVVPIYEMRDMGIACVGGICVFNGFLKCVDVTEIQANQLDTWMAGGTPYGIVPSNLCNRVRYKIAWSDFGEPRNWAPLITGTIQSATKNKITLTRPAPYSFPVGAKLAVIGAGVNGGTLGGQVGYDDGVEVTAVNGSEITIETSADAGLTYPLTVQVTRFADVSTFSGSATIKDDSSPIIAIKPLKQIVVVYRQTGIWIGRYTGNVETPFQYKPAYSGALVPVCSRAIADVQGDYHLYPTADGFYFFDGAGDPRIHSPMDDASSLYFGGFTPAFAQKAVAIHNPITLEIWFLAPNGVLAFDYAQKTVSWIDQAYSAAAYVRRPGSEDFWFIMARAGQVLQYGATANQHITVQRLGAAVTHTLRHGEVHLNDDESEKDLKSYLPLFSLIENPVTVTLFGRDNIASAREQLFALEITDPALEPQVECFYRNIYFQDQITYVSTADAQVEYVGSTFTFDAIGAGGVTRSDNGS